MSLFFKKYELAEVIDGMVDIHNHLLPGIDDGAKNLTATEGMLQEFKRLGIHTLATSPHIMQGVYPNTPMIIAKAHSEVKTLLNEKKIGIRLLGSAAEYMLEDNFIKLLKSRTLCTLGEKHLLVEMSYLQPPLRLEELIFEIKHAGYKPILAHPERYNFLNDKKEYEKLLKLGCEFQLNLLALSRHYGISVQKKALDLLKNGKYSFVGTDAHHVQHLQKIGQITIRKKQAQALKSLVKNNKSLFS